MELIGVALPAQDESSVREMAECFVEEFVRMGFPPGRVLALFRSPRYAAAHTALRILGEDTIRAMIENFERAWRPAGDR
ncbi:MAG: hypothetical protein HYY05_07970 [Chloroflexi bacterium]|nr:hypothetical protein [Chloroflexota bacterium]